MSFAAKSRLPRTDRQTRTARLAAPRRPKRRATYRPRGWVLTRGELAFYRKLCQAVGSRLLVFSKVRLADVIRCDRLEPEWGSFAAISQKHLDFVLCDPWSTRIHCAVELDDRSHRTPHRRRRDAFVDRALRLARVPLLRFKAAARYDLADLSEALRTALPSSPTER